jgi:hypothetical protein
VKKSLADIAEESFMFFKKRFKMMRRNNMVKRETKTLLVMFFE